MENSNIYFPEHRAMQEMMGTVALADKWEEMIIHDIFSDCLECCTAQPA